MLRFARVIVGRRVKWLVVAGWLAVAAAVVLLGLPAKFEQVQENDPVTFLPEDVESVRALEAVQRLPGPEGNPAIIVVSRRGGLTAADRQAIGSLASGLREEAPGTVTTVAPPQYAPRSHAALIVATLRATGDSDRLLETVSELRARADRLAAGSGGLRAAVTGPAGYAADFSSAFSGINSTLLAVTAALVFVLLIGIYRSPIFWMIPLAAVGVAEVSSRGLGYLAAEAGLSVNGQSAGILLVLVFGAGTDYALLLVARYREELGRHADRHEAAAVALARAAPPIVASAATVIAALLVLLLAQVNATAGLGPIGAIGVALALATSLTLLPALLATTGRRAFWPFIPRAGDGEATRGPWRRVGDRIARRPRRVWLAGAGTLIVLCGGLAFADIGLPQAGEFRSEPESVRGQELLAEAFPAGAVAPTTVVVPPDEPLDRVRSLLRDTEGIASVSDQVRRGPPGAVLDVVLAPDPYSERAFEVVERLRDRLDAEGLGGTLVGGETAIERDYRAAAFRDDIVVPPIVLAVVLAILAVVLRALVLPAVLILTVIASYGAALGVGALVFSVLFGFAGIEPTIVLIAFIFLVGLGVDYNIFLMTRVREEAARHGHAEGVLRGLAATGAVITSAGIVLAGTFAALGVLPLVPLTEIGFLVAFGILLDTLLVRSVIVPALSLDVGPGIWWPSALAKRPAQRRAQPPPAPRSSRELAPVQAHEADHER